ncbi:hypothetical protein JCM8547_005560 [Rhodosporidiobolus lusitaniae]
MASDNMQLGTIIWSSVKPLIRILIPAGVGFLLQKLGTLPPDGSRTLALVQIRFALPCLLFAKIVPSFTHDNVSAIGPIILCGFFYQAFPGALGIIGRAIAPSPRRFRYGQIAAYTFGNWGDLPFSMVASVAASKPFNGSTDENLGSAFVAIFILVNYISMFPLQGLRLCQLDYTKRVSASLERQYEDGEFGTVGKWWNRLYRGRPMPFEVEEERRRLREERGEEVGKEKEVEAEEGEVDVEKQEQGEGEGAKKRRPPMMTSVGVQANGVSRNNEEDEPITAVPLNPPPPSPDFPILEPHPSNLSHHTFSSSHHSLSSSHPPPGPTKRVLLSIWSFFRPLATSPPTVALFTALIIALVPALRALFVAPTTITPTTFHPTAPDGDPPLAILYSTADFVGGASVPLGLTVLGASMAKLQIPRPITRLPLQSIAVMAVVRIVITAVVGFFFVNQLVRSGMVSESATMLRFVLTLFACVPTATTQVSYSQIFAPSGAESNADLLAGYLILQYILWAFANVILTAVSLTNIT